MTGTPHRIVNVVIVGTAGQGVITLKRLVEFIAAREGYKGIFGSEMHGLAQREGAISSHCRLQRVASANPRENIHASTIAHGDADLVVGLEPVEVLRNGCLFASAKTMFVVNERDIPPIMVTAGRETYPPVDEILGALRRYNPAGRNVVSLNATRHALDRFGDARVMNTYMFGVALATGILDFNMATCEAVMRDELHDPDKNIAAMRAGLEHGRALLLTPR